MKPLISKPINDTQVRFNELCLKGGGPGGGPARSKVLELLRESGQELNKLAFEEAQEFIAELSDANPWHLCFAMGLCWGHLAKLDIEFAKAAVSTLEKWSAADLSKACSYHLERGPKPIEQSLTGAKILFDKVILPAKLPNDLKTLHAAQQRWLGHVLHPTNRPPYIGAWNSTAMFMVALFAQPALAVTRKRTEPALPPGGPIHAGLSYLYKAKITTGPPAARADSDQTGSCPRVASPAVGAG